MGLIIFWPPSGGPVPIPAPMWVDEVQAAFSGCEELQLALSGAEEVQTGLSGIEEIQI